MQNPRLDSIAAITLFKSEVDLYWYDYEQNLERVRLLVERTCPSELLLSPYCSKGCRSDIDAINRSDEELHKYVQEKFQVWRNEILVFEKLREEDYLYRDKLTKKGFNQDTIDVILSSKDMRGVDFSKLLED